MRQVLSMFVSSLTGLIVWKGRGDSLALPVSRGVQAELAAASVVQPTLVLVLALAARAVQLEARVTGALETTRHIQTPPALTGDGQALQYKDGDLETAPAQSLSSLTSSTSSHLPSLNTKPG